MDINWDEIVNMLPFLAPILFLIFNVWLRKRRGQESPTTVISSLLSENEFNQELVESFSTQLQIKKFRKTTWNRNKDKLGYLGDSGLYSKLADAYDFIEDFNRDIDMATKYNSTSYLLNIRVDKLRGPLNEVKHGLQNWLEINKDNEPASVPTS
ncbi:hypothetical protein ACFLUJ_06090 [Chloroflexota bacterium]